MHTTPSELARFILYAAVAELADAQDLKSCGTNLPCRFDSGLRHCGFDKRALVAQLVEQRTENPRVTGSIPVLGMLAGVVQW